MTNHAVFNFDDWAGKDVVMHCKTQAEAEDFCKVMHAAGKRWCDGDSYADITMGEIAESGGMYYNFNLGLYDNTSFFYDKGYTVLEWSDYMQPSIDTAKDDANKPRLSLVPMQIVWDIADVRAYGNKKYGDPDNWKTVEMQRYVDALLRHTLAFVENYDSVDEESGLAHYKHMACNMAFICAMMAKNR